MEQTIFEVLQIKQVGKKLPKKYIGLVPSAIRSPRDVTSLASKLIGDSDREHFLVICLSTKNQVNAVHIVHTGSLNATIVSPREIFKAAILNNSNSIIVCHNHPSQTLLPSREDLEVTKRIQKSGDILDIQVLDHLIVSANDGLSLKEKGYM